MTEDGVSTLQSKLGRHGDYQLLPVAISESQQQPPTLCSPLSYPFQPIPVSSVGTGVLCRREEREVPADSALEPVQPI